MIIILDVNIISQCTIQLYSHTLHVVYTVLLLSVGMYIAAHTYIQYMCTVCVYWILIYLFLLLHSKNCGVHSTPNSCHTIGCESHQLKFGVLCTPSHGVTVSWCAQHTNLGVLCTPIIVRHLTMTLLYYVYP